ncbi:1-acyl-sn-glycerol-3-phosphate acyltransferase [Oceanispirochaeta sp.]|jgi:glycerol-3-phosphate O-acyltransferase|uniref:1-acyl-sn-glycerol-3-phosphate acyltransferase n=1 Tax=Oceanispirochaeta sp. TaxID=2035350 RepID=UPI00262ADA72|nr:1-acyl-sn-glycerol-3-phosphate acyltransferase [Oceanispirochaeta sp.]MDA3957795.1 1-acyl-sn-glycerol-3-phosphate acyltransferase [Oceanispirochaeta sp.]
MNISVERLLEMIEALKNNLHGDYVARPDNVYLEGEPKNRKIIGDLVEKIMKPGSAIRGVKNLKELYERSQKGKACLLLIEHYSNFDYPALYRLIEKTEDLGPEVAETLLPIQGMKLSESSGLTAAFSNSYNTIVIYPSRSIDSESDPVKQAEIRKISMPINHSAMKELTHRKYHGNIVIVFPAGTRYRSWVPESKKGVREIYTYLKAFDYVSFVSINGNLLPPSKEDNMEKDTFQSDVILFTVSKPVKGKDFRNEKTALTPEGTDSKQFVVDQVMAELDKQHQEAEECRKTLL